MSKNKTPRAAAATTATEAPVDIQRAINYARSVGMTHTDSGRFAKYVVLRDEFSDDPRMQAVMDLTFTQFAALREGMEGL